MSVPSGAGSIAAPRPGGPPSVAILSDAASWREDFAWHQHMYKGAQLRWTRDDVLAIAMEATAGRLTFTTVADMSLVAQGLQRLSSYCGRVHAASAATMRAAADGVGGFDELAAILGEPVMTLRVAAGGDALVTPPERCPTHVFRVLRAVPWPNPLTLTWELLQVRYMLSAAEDLLEDAVCDLYVELRESRPVSVLERAAQADWPGQLEGLVEDVYARRGGPGSPARAQLQRLPEVGAPPWPAPKPKPTQALAH